MKNFMGGFLHPRRPRGPDWLLHVLQFDHCHMQPDVASAALFPRTSGLPSHGRKPDKGPDVAVPVCRWQGTTVSFLSSFTTHRYTGHQVL